MPETQPVERLPYSSRLKPLEWLIVLALFVQVLLFLNTAGMKAGIDFYQYWGVGHVIRLTEGEVRNPYTEHRIFNEILAEDARRFTDSDSGHYIFHPRYKSTLVPIFMIASVFFASSLLLQIAWYARSILQFESTNQPEFISYWIMSSWIPLWLGLLNIVSTCGSRLIDPASICSGPSPSVDIEAIKNDETCISSNDIGHSAGQ